MTKRPGILSVLKPYWRLIMILLVFTLLGNAINLFLPWIIAQSIDDFIAGRFLLNPVLIKFSIAVVFIFIFTWLQTIIQTYASERVARDLRTRLSDKISKQDNAFIARVNASKLLTNLTGDVDSIKMFISQAIVSVISSIFIIIGASVLLLSINWKLGLCIILIIPIIGITFFLVLRKVRSLFIQSRAIIDQLNKVINESILGAALIRVVNSQQLEYDKFLDANVKAKGFGLSILRLFAGLIPIITFTANIAMLTILALGGHFVITGSMSLGDLAAFTSYLSMLIFPILIIGFMSSVIAQASASHQRISVVMETPDLVDTGVVTKVINGDIRLEDVNVVYGQRPVLENITFTVSAGTKVAVIGPTAAGKTQLLYLLTGLVKPQSGSVQYDGHDIDKYNSESFHSQVGLVFQDSIIFNMSIRENIAFSDTVTDASLEKAIETAELKEFVEALPDKLNTIVSGGQKQRIMLARALALDPKILLLDDFTARVDTNTERRILENIQNNYPGLTLVSITQRISSVEHYDQIILLMQGEIIAIGRHEELIQSSPEYIQLLNSQQSTSNYELQS